MIYVCIVLDVLLTYQVASYKRKVKELFFVLQLEHMIHISDSCEATYKSTKNFEFLRTNQKNICLVYLS